MEEKMKKILLTAIFLAIATNCGAKTQVHNAALSGSIKRLKYLVEKLGRNIEPKDAQGLTPLHYACLRGFLEGVKYLASKGAKVNDKSNTSGDTPLIIASYSGHQDIVKYLLEEKKVNINTKNKKRRTALDLAIISEKREDQNILELTEKLVKKKFDSKLRNSIQDLRETLKVLTERGYARYSILHF